MESNNHEILLLIKLRDYFENISVYIDKESKYYYEILSKIEFNSLKEDLFFVCVMFSFEDTIYHCYRKPKLEKEGVYCFTQRILHRTNIQGTIDREIYYIQENVVNTD